MKDSLMMNRTHALFLFAASACFLTAADRPNILWLVIDDMGCEFSYYGEEVIETPNIDRLAREGTRFTNAFLTSPVCSTARSAMITGMY